MGCEAFGDGIIDSSFINVHYCDKSAAALAGHGRDEQPDSTGAYDEGCGTGSNSSAVEGVDCNGQRLEESGGVERDVVWESKKISFWIPDLGV